MLNRVIYIQRDEWRRRKLSRHSIVFGWSFKTMRLFYCLAIGMILARSLGLCCFAEWMKTPHAHVAVNMVTPMTSAHQHGNDSSKVSPMDESPVTIMHGGAVLFVSFGEWNNLLSDFYFLASPYTQRLSEQRPMIAKIDAPDFFSRQVWRLQLDPPPRPVS